MLQQDRVAVLPVFRFAVLIDLLNGLAVFILLEVVGPGHERIFARFAVAVGPGPLGASPGIPFAVGIISVNLHPIGAGRPQGEGEILAHSDLFPVHHKYHRGVAVGLADIEGHVIGVTAKHANAVCPGVHEIVSPGQAGGGDDRGALSVLPIGQPGPIPVVAAIIVVVLVRIVPHVEPIV